MKFVQKIAVKSQKERKNAIVGALQNMGAKYYVQKGWAGLHRTQNIVVSCNPSNSRLVVGAHWDSVKGSTGANDNASGCSVLLHLIESLKDTKRSIDFVFFDREEVKGHGSETYLAKVGKQNISAMINLDMCGHGENIVVSDKGNKNNPLFVRALDTATINSHQVTTVFYLPNGDDDRFDEAHIPNISVCTLGKSDLEFFQYIGQLLQEEKMPTEEDQKKFMNLDVISTMHLGANDNIAAVSQSAIDKVASWLTDGLR